MGQQLLREVRHDIARTIMPDWFKETPKNIGDPKQGKLSAKEWRSIFTVGFLVTLMRIWGANYGSEGPRTGQEEVLDNFLHLVIAMRLGTQGAIRPWVIRLYDHHMRQYLEGFRLLYPTQSFLPYHHLSLHFSEFLQLLGPWEGHGAPPCETYNGMCQKINTNKTFGALISPCLQGLLIRCLGLTRYHRGS